MNQTVSSGTTPNSPEEVRALAWVADEVRRSLESGHKVLHRYLREAEALVGSDVDHVDPTVLRNARTHFHQAAGALELVGMAVPAQTMRASEKAIQRLAERPANLTPKAVETIERASFALLDYIGRLTAGKPVSGVALFPQYQGLLELAGADRIHPADLWDHDWAWRSIERDPEALFVEPDDAARDAMERLILRVMRSPDRQTMRRMSDLCAGLGAEAKGRRETLWRLAAGFFEALAAGLLRLDMHVKRLAPRLLAQARLGLRSSDVSDRLARDLLFFCARSRVPEQEQQAPRLMAVRRAYRLEGPELPDYDTPSLGRFDPAVLAQARRRLAAAREAWNAMAGGEPHRAQNLPDSFSLVQDSLELLYPDGAELGQSLMAAVHAVGPTVVAPPLAMEVATAILYLEASLENAEFDDPQLASRVRRLAARIDAVRQGSEPPPLDSWMEELYRQVSDMQTIGSVVQELRGSFGEIEKQLDHYFREPADREVLQAVPGQLMSLRGVLSVLGLDAATQAVLRMREDVERLAQGAAAPAEGPGGQAVLERLADNLGALTFLIDMLAVQPQLAKRLFRFDAETGHLRALMAVPPGRDSGFSDPMSDSGPGDLSERTRRIGQQAERPDVSDEALSAEMRSLAQQAMLAEERRLADTLTAARNALEQATDAEQRRTLRAELAAHMHQLGGAPEPALPAAADVPAAALAPAGPPSGSAMAAAPAPASFDAEAGDDGEVLAVFLEEATEVIALARESLQRLQTEAHDADDDLPQMTAVRRAFHTLKGSSRMVGLAEFGEAAWSCEQLYNSRLAQSARMEPGLHAFTQQALDYLGDWTAAISQGHNGGHRKLEISAAADALRLEGRAIDLPLPAAAAQQPQAAAQVREETIEAAAPALPEVPVEAPREAADDLASQGTGAEQLPVASD